MSEQPAWASDRHCEICGELFLLASPTSSDRLCGRTMCSEINKEATRLERQRATTQLDYRVVVIELLLERDGRDCRRCGASLGVDLQCNHIHRREHGGLNTLSNLELLCEECHRFEARIEYRSRPIPLQSLDEQLERLLTGGRR